MIETLKTDQLELGFSGLRDANWLYALFTSSRVIEANESLVRLDTLFSLRVCDLESEFEDIFCSKFHGCSRPRLDREPMHNKVVIPSW